MEYCLNIHDESVAVANVRRAFEYISRSVLLCNVNTYTGIKLSKEKILSLEIDLIARNARPLIEYLNGGRLRRAEVIGKGTKKEPYIAQWRNDYFIDS